MCKCEVDRNPRRSMLAARHRSSNRQFEYYHNEQSIQRDRSSLPPKSSPLCDSEAEHGPAQAGFAGRPDFFEAARKRLCLFRLVDSERCARLLEMKAVQIVHAVDDH